MGDVFITRPNLSNTVDSKSVVQNESIIMKVISGVMDLNLVTLKKGGFKGGCIYKVEVSI